jgi:type II secretory pathway pseudopilin PulG
MAGQPFRSLLRRTCLDAATDTLSRTRGARAAVGATTLETLFVLAVLSIMAGMTVVVGAEWRGRSRAVGAARLVMQQVRVARALAVRDGANVGLVFRRDTRGALTFRIYRDGNGNGVRRADIDRSVDPPMATTIRLDDWFAGTALRVPSSLPPIDDGPGVAEGSDPIRLAGGSSILSCAPSGTLTPGTIYVAGPRNEAYAVRLLGPTGRVRLFEYANSTSAWIERW